MVNRSQQEILSQSDETPLDTIAHLLHTCGADAPHAHQVARLALFLFDQLQTLHGFQEKERAWLQNAALLHDIGWVEGEKNHHKASLHMILTTHLLPFSSKERLIIGSIARYHRKALPRLEHDHYHALKSPEREVVAKLASFLRVAEGLDHSHQGKIDTLVVQATRKKILIYCYTQGSATEEQTFAQTRSDLLGLVFDRKIIFRWNKNLD